MAKRRIAVLRAVLSEVADGTDHFSASDDAERWYHAWLLDDGGYLECVHTDTLEERCVDQCRLTWKGQDLLDLLQNDEVLDQAQQSADAVVGDRDNLEVVLGYIRRELRSTSD